MAKPKRWTSWRVCPNCGDRSTKLFHLSARDRPYKCQICDHRYNPPKKSRARPGRVVHTNDFGYEGEGANGCCYVCITPSHREGFAYLDVGWSCVVVHNKDIPVTWLAELVAIATGHKDGVAGFLRDQRYGGDSYALMCDPPTTTPRVLK